MKKNSKVLAIILCSILPVFMLVVALSPTIRILTDMEHYQRVYQNPITVTATVTNHDTKESDEDTDYLSYISYVVNGVQYKNVTYENKNKEAELTPVNTQIEVQVSPEDPSRLISDLKSEALELFLWAIILSSIITIAYSFLIKSRRSKEMQNTSDREVIERDMKLTVQSRFFRPLSLLLLVFFVFLLLRYPVILKKEAFIAVAICAVFWLWSMYTTIRDYRYIKNENYEIRRDVLIEKKYIPDSDGDVYKLKYSSDEKTWTTNTDKKTYEKIKEGDIISAVYLPKKKKPLLHYDINGTAK